MKKLRLAIFGIGRIGKVHLKNIIKHRKCNLLYIYDTDYNKRKKLCKKHNVKFVEDIQREEGGGVRIAVIFDAARKTFRNEIYPDYKANRSDPPEDLIPQFELIKKVPLVFNIPSIQLEGYEADDLIATYAHAASKLGQNTSIVSSDKDLMQLIDEKVSMIDPLKKNKLPKKMF